MNGAIIPSVIVGACLLIGLTFWFSKDRETAPINDDGVNRFTGAKPEYDYDDVELGGGRRTRRRNKKPKKSRKSKKSSK